MVSYRRIQPGILCHSIFLILFFVGITQAKPGTDKETMHLVGSVRSVSIVKNGQIETTQNFDHNGNMTEELYHSPNGIVGKTVVTYDDNGKKIESARYGKDGDIRIKTVFIYDPDGNLIEDIQYDSQNTLRGKRTFTNDENGNQVGMVVYRDSVTVKSRYVYIYDSKGNLTEERRYKNGSNDRELKTVNTYDDRGNKIEEKIYGADGSWSVSHVYTYDSKGNMIDWKTNQADGLNSRITFTYTYDSVGNWTKCINRSQPAFGDSMTIVINRTLAYY
jgi:antitoxin component YwqK of YwqJK toxin-antitoxin module